MSVITNAINKVTNTLAESVYDNPVMTKEFRTRMRGWKAYSVMGGYVLLLAAFLFIHYIIIANENVSYYQHGYNPLGNLKIGQRLFGTLSCAQAIMLMFIVPSLTSGAITLEIEKKTIEMLVLSRITAGKIVLGKHLSGFFYALMLLVCSIPLAGICLMLGGISPAEVFSTYALLAGTAFLFASISLVCSSMVAKTAGASMLSYMLCIGYMVFTSTFSSMATFSPHSESVFALAQLNPIFSAYGMSLSTSEVCGIKISTALAAFVLEIAAGWLFILIASTHVKHRKVERALSIRLLLLAITGFTIWLGIGSVASILSFYWRPATAKDMMNIVYVVSCILVPFFCLMPVALATGELKECKKPIIDALAGRFIFKTDMRGAIPFMALWTAFAYASFIGTLYWLSRVMTIPTNKGFWPMCFYIGIASVFIVTGISSIGVLASSISKNRKSAAGLVIFFVLILFAGYGFVLAYYESSYMHHTDSFIYQTAALWPLTPVIGQIEWTRDMPKLWWNPKNSWAISTYAYILITAVCLSLAGPALRKSGGVKEDIGDS